VGGSSVMFAITFCVVLGGCEGFTTEKTIKDFADSTVIIIVFTMFFGSIAILIFLLFYQRTMYVDASLFTLTCIRGKRVARKCKICGKHPYFQKYHAKKLHNLKITKLEENFDDCGCDLCYERKTNWKDAFSD